MSSPTALYRMYAVDDSLLYVGISMSMAMRMAMHRRDKPWWYDIATIGITWYENRDLAAAHEIDAIKNEHPLYNIMHGSPTVFPEEAGPVELVAQLEREECFKDLDIDVRRFYSMAEAADALAVTQARIVELIHDGGLRSRRFGSDLAIHGTALLEAVQPQRKVWRFSDREAHLALH